MAPGTTKSPQRGILLFLDNRWTEIAFKHVALESLLNAFDAVFPINSLKLFRHQPDNLEISNLRTNRLVFYRLPDGKLMSHVMDLFLVGQPPIMSTNTPPQDLIPVA